MKFLDWLDRQDHSLGRRWAEALALLAWMMGSWAAPAGASARWEQRPAQGPELVGERTVRSASSLFQTGTPIPKPRRR